MGEVPQTDRKKILLVFIILVILIFFGLFLYNFRKKDTENRINKARKDELILLEDSKDPEYPSEMKISASTVKAKVGSSVEVAVSVKGGGREIFGSDAVLKYDPSLLEVIDGSLKTADVFQNYPRLEAKGGGTVVVTAYGAGDKNMENSNTFFKVAFQALKTGKAKISFDFEKGRTSGTTVVENGTSRNILGKVNEVTVDIIK